MTCDTNIFTKNGLKRQNISTFEIASKEGRGFVRIHYPRICIVHLCNVCVTWALMFLADSLLILKAHR